MLTPPLPSACGSTCFNEAAGADPADAAAWENNTALQEEAELQ